VSEYGVNISKFRTEKQFVSHLKLAPQRPVSGGKVLKKRRKQLKGTRTAEALRHAATALKKSHSALGAYYRRMARRKDGSIAVFATARQIATLSLPDDCVGGKNTWISARRHMRSNIKRSGSGASKAQPPSSASAGPR
jgi:transposase IS116/IS110/IS902 family protein